jgi:hypothetical protein
MFTIMITYYLVFAIIYLITTNIEEILKMTHKERLIFSLNWPYLLVKNIYKRIKGG